MTESLRDVVNAEIEAAYEARFGLEFSPASAPREMIEFLHDVRGRLDQVEERLFRMLRMRARAAERNTLAEAEAQDAWDQAAHRARTSPVATDEYSSAKERTAQANLACLDQRLAARRTAESLRVCDQGVEALRLAQRGLEGVRQDARLVIQGMTFESHLDR